MSFNTITSILDSLFTSVVEYDINNIPLEINFENTSILLSCIKNYYKIKLNILLKTLINPHEKINMFNKTLPEIYKKISELEIEQGFKFKIFEFLIKEILETIELVNNQLILESTEKNLNAICSCYIKMKQLEHNILEMYSSINLTFTTQYEGLILEKIVKIFCEFEEKLKNIFIKETFELIESNTILHSYLDFCIGLKYIIEQLEKIEIDVVKKFIKIQMINMYNKYFDVINKNDLSLDSNFLLLNTIYKINTDIKVLQLECDDLTNKYDDLYYKIFNKISIFYSKEFISIVKTNINYSIVNNCVDKIINIFNETYRSYIDEEVNNTIFNIMVDKLTNELTGMFVFNNEKPSISDDLIINFDILIAELLESLLVICRTHNYNTTKVINSIKKIKLVRNYYAYVDSNEDIIREEFIAIYGDLELFNQLKNNKKNKMSSISKISNFTAGKISSYASQGINYFKHKKFSAK